MYVKVVLVLLCWIIKDFNDGARILAPFIFPSYSHQVVYHAVCKELAHRGHEVIFFTANPLEESSVPNLRQIDISFVSDTWKIRKELMKLDGSTPLKELLTIDMHLLAYISEQVLACPEMQLILHNGTESFDLVLVEWMQPVLFALSAWFNCPLVGMNSMDLLDPLYADADNPTHPILYPNMFLAVSDTLSFWDRLVSFDMSMWLRLYFDSEVYPASDIIARRYLGADLPPIKQITRNVSMVFVNTIPLFSANKPTVPTVVEFSGVHLNRPKPLPQDIQEFLDAAPYGAVYFSLGSNIQSHLLPDKLTQEIVSTFAELPYKVLWKFDKSNMTGLTSNVMVGNWLPQQDILSHPNVKVFIMQGGLQSLEEAIRKRVPIVGMPFYVDQPKNINRMVKLGIGQAIDKASLTKESFKRIITEVVEKSNYRRNVEHVANLLEDLPMNSLDKVTWWIEYVIRHKGAQHLKSPYLQVPRYQYYLWDILAFYLLCMCVAYLVVQRITTHLVASVKSGRKTKRN